MSFRGAEPFYALLLCKYLHCEQFVLKLAFLLPGSGSTTFAMEKPAFSNVWETSQAELWCPVCLSCVLGPERSYRKVLDKQTVTRQLVTQCKPDVT